MLPFFHPPTTTTMPETVDNTRERSPDPTSPTGSAKELEVVCTV